ncbi:MAG: hypothetical protein JST81_01375 [Bacteroidetes bacterium]|nr:hypothetical protein [Bacteroidota bacterium]
MPESKKRHTHHKHAHPQTHAEHIAHEKKKSSAKTPMMIFCAVLAFFVGWFTVGTTLWLAVVILAGLVIGYFLGNQMDKSMSKS